MSDNIRRYKAIRNTLNHLYPEEPKGNVARQLNTLAALISGIVGSKKSNLPAIADKVPDGNKPESRVKRYYRGIANDTVDAKMYFLPFAKMLLTNLAQSALFMPMDSSLAGRGCVTLLISVIYKKRALPVAWIVVKGKKGHLPEEVHMELVEQIHQMVPEGIPVVLLGDGEFDGTRLLAHIESFIWKYVCRTAKDRVLSKNDKKFHFDDFPLIKGKPPISVPDVLFTLKAYGPIHAIAWWEKQYKDPLYLVTNVLSVEIACCWYKKRFRIETFFSDQKSRGFNLDKSHLSDPQRLSRFMLAACLAYIWIMFLGVQAVSGGFHKFIHRTDRCDLSLFQLGFRFLEHLLNYEIPIPVLFFYAFKLTL